MSESPPIGAADSVIASKLMFMVARVRRRKMYLWSAFYLFCMSTSSGLYGVPFRQLCKRTAGDPSEGNYWTRKTSCLSARCCCSLAYFGRAKPYLGNQHSSAF